jgi:serine-type D-Ala-D-Ala carboxypeptidase (penicillin-binding protein 5/6)
MRVPGRLALGAAAAGVLIAGAVPAWPSAASAAAHRPAGAALAVHRPAAAALAAARRAAAPPAVQAKGAPPPAVQAKGAALENAATGALLWSRDLDTRRPIASITKVMTALVVLRAGHLGQLLTVPAAAVSYTQRWDGSSAGLYAGDRLTVQQLLEAMLLPSGCDAAYVLASAYGPGLTPFVAKMNALAGQMHLGRTHFSNFDGLPQPTEYSTYSTPGDLLAIGRAAMAYPAFRAIVSQHRYYLGASPEHHAYLWHNTNLLLGAYPGTIGIKTGSTLAAGYCLLFEAQRGPAALIGVVLDSSPSVRAVSFSDAGTMLTWGFG